MQENKIQLLKQILERIEGEIETIKRILTESAELKISEADSPREDDESFSKHIEEEKRIIEGIFDGEKMIGPDGKKYSIPPNYASKSKLVEGDKLKLTILPSGAFVYKQTGPVERQRVVGTLKRTEDESFCVQTEDKVYKVLMAAVTYFKGKEGDEAIGFVTKDGNGNWMAVENILKRETFLEENLT